MRTTTISGASLKFLEQPDKVKDIVRAEFRIYQLFLVAQDLLLTYFALRIAYLVRFQVGFNFFQESIVPQIPVMRDVMFYLSPVWVAIFAFMGLYKIQNLLGDTREYSMLFNAITLGMFLMISAGFLFADGLILARGWVILAWALAFLFTAVGRFASRRVVYSMRESGHFQVPGIIIGVNDEGRLLAEQFYNWHTSAVRVVGYVDEHHCHELDAHYRHLGKPQDLDKIIDRYGISEIILTGSALSQEEVLALFRKYGTAKNINLRMSSGLYEIITTGMQVKNDGLVSLFTMNKVRLTGGDQVLKLLLDYAIAIPLAILLLPVFAVIALAVKLDSRGPVIYRRRVLGVNGQQFDAFKFRTMHVNSEEILRSHPELMKEYQENFKLKNDPRVTRVGKLLRKTSLDEMPQIFNVVFNQMSLVGPRMICPEELSKYSQWNINLLTVKPGITGLWQVRGRSDVSYDERVKLDMFYIRNWNIWLDLQILFQTIPAVLTHKGAY